MREACLSDTSVRTSIECILGSLSWVKEREEEGKPGNEERAVPAQRDAPVQEATACCMR